MDSRDVESDVYGEEHAPPSYYGEGPPMKTPHGAPLMNDNPGGHPQYHMHPMTSMPRPGEQVAIVAMAPKTDEEGAHIVDDDYGSCHLVCSFISVFICSICGLIALVCAMLGYTDFRTGNKKRYAWKRKCAIAWMIITWLSGGAIIGLYMYFRQSLMQQQCDPYRDPYCK